MKRLVISGVCLILFGVILWGSIGYVNQSVEILMQHLEQSIAHAKQNNMALAQKELEQARLQWDKRRKLLMIYVEQDLIDELDNQLVYMNALTQYHDEEYIPTAFLCMEQLRELEQRENFSLSSWF